MPPQRGPNENRQNPQGGQEPDADDTAFLDQDDEAGEFEEPGFEGEEPGVSDEGDEGEQEAAGEGQPVRQPQRRQPDDREIELIRLRAENEALKRVQPAQPSVAPAQQGENDQQFEQRVAQLEPFEQLTARQQRAEQRHQQSMLFLQAQTADQLDRASFLARAAADPRFARYAEEVERRHQQFLQGGPTQAPQLVPRETILKLILGERAMQPANREQRRQQERQQRKMQRQQVRPSSSRGDVGSGRERTEAGSTEREARRRRLENVEI